MISVAVRAVGLMAPGLAGWNPSMPLLRGEAPYVEEPLPPLKPERLKPNERRRTSQTIKLALVVADEALRQVPGPDELLSVFASPQGDLDIMNQICLALTREDRPVSPTQFHNSVHNAPAGYWSIASGYRQASSSLAALDGSFGSGLLEAAVQAVHEERPVLLVAYDLPAPAPLDQLIPNRTHFGVALLLAPESASDDDRLARLDLQPVAETTESTMTEPSLESLRSALPVARSLPLLSALARRERCNLLLPYLDDLGLGVEVSPC